MTQTTNVFPFQISSVLLLGVHGKKSHAIMEASTAHCHGLDWFLRQDPKTKNPHHQTLSYTLFFLLQGY